MNKMSEEVEEQAMIEFLKLPIAVQCSMIDNKQNIAWVNGCAIGILQGLNIAAQNEIDYLKTK